MKIREGFWFGLHPYFNSSSFMLHHSFLRILLQDIVKVCVLLVLIYNPGLIRTIRDIDETDEQGDLIVSV